MFVKNANKEKKKHQEETRHVTKTASVQGPLFLRVFTSSLFLPLLAIGEVFLLSALEYCGYFLKLYLCFIITHCSIVG